MTANRKKRMIIYTVCVSVLLALAVWIAWGNTALELNTYTIASKKLPETFDGYRIAHISDLHNSEMGGNNLKLINMLHDSKPDIIVITGDLIDSRNTNIDIALEFAEQLIKIAPCYYVTGNHEARVTQYADLNAGLTELGVVTMEDERLELVQSEEAITLLGVNDPSFQIGYVFGDADSVMNDKLHKLKKENDVYTILLSHRPELFDIYVKNSIDLVLSGHAHGGQFRIPFVGGLVAPNQGFLPKYDSGIYTEENTNMIVSRGIGNSIIPFRINNRPEIILIELKTA